MWTLGPHIPDLGPWNSRTLLNSSEEWKKITLENDSEYGGEKKIKKEKKRKENEMKRIVDWRIIRIIIELEK